MRWYSRALNRRVASWVAITVASDPVYGQLAPAALPGVRVRRRWLGQAKSSAAAILLVVPVVMPLVRQVGIDPIHFGIIVTINLGVGQQTPPVASVLFTTSAIAGLSFWEVFRRGWPFTLVLALVTLLITYVPWLSLFLVRLVYP